MNETTLTFTSADGTRLEGSLLLPDDRTPKALLALHQGSTLCDRDGQVTRTGVPSTLYRKLARMFALEGFASFRFDKRQHDTPVPLPLTYSLTNRVDDFVAAIAELRIREEVANLPLALVGHSEGGVIAQLAALQQTPEALVVLASPAVTLIDSMRWRAMHALAHRSERGRRIGSHMLAANIELQRRCDLDEDFTPQAFEAFRNWYAARQGMQGWESWPWLKEHAALDILQAAAPLACPTLHLHGDRDTTVSSESLRIYEEAWRKVGRPNVTCGIVSNMGHFLEDSTRKAFVVSEALVARVSAWLNEGLGAE